MSRNSSSTPWGKITVFTVAFAIAGTASAKVIYVDDHPAAHFRGIQAAIDDANDGDIIVVGEGWYEENINFNGKNITLRSTDPNDPNIVIATVIDGDGNGSVVTISDRADKNCVLNGFTIVNGHDDGSGGGIDCQGSSPTIANCIIRGNSAGWYGGGMYHDVGSPTLTNCTFLGNSAGYGGGGMYTHESSPSLTACSFIGNVAETLGGGLYNVSSDIVVTNCLFIGNSVKDTFRGGGGLFNSHSNVTLINCILSENSAPGLGGAVYHRYDASLNVINSTLTSNSAGDGGGIYSKLCNLWIGNSILWGNEPNEFSGELPGVSYSDIQGGWPGEGNINCDPCFADPGYWDANGTPGDVNDDFWVDGDYRLKSQAGRWDPNSQTWIIDDVTSPCIDAGDPMSPIGPEPFPNGGMINMGAYGGTIEASKSYFAQPPCEIIVAGDINGDCEVNFRDFWIMALHWCEER